MFDAILSDIAAGEPTHRACTEHSVPRKAFYAFIATDESAGNRYARAKQAGLEVMADDILAIADDGSGDVEIRTNAQGEEYAAQNTEFAARSRLRVDSRKWLLSKLAPKKYGERLQHEGVQDGVPINLAVNFVKPHA